MSLTVLLCEDDEGFLEAEADILLSENYTVLEAVNGDAALEIIRTKEIDLLVTDILMPEMTGFELMEKAKVLMPDLKVIGVSGSTRFKTHFNGAHEELDCPDIDLFDEFLWKPFTARRLLSLIDKLTLDSAPDLANSSEELGSSELESSELESKEITKPLADIKILLVENLAMSQIIARTILEENGAIISNVNDGVEALEYLSQKSDVDLILMDIEMPRMNGYETTEKILNNSKLCHIPIMALTVHALQSDIQKCLDVGMKAHIAKPINVDEMIKTIMNNLSVKK